jgi:hypothetical protein
MLSTYATSTWNLNFGTLAIFRKEETTLIMPCFFCEHEILTFGTLAMIFSNEGGDRPRLSCINYCFRAGRWSLVGCA